MADLEKNNYNLKELASVWGEYIDWEKRRSNENGFLIKTLEKYKANKVINLALGDGCDSIHLIQKGFSVVSNEYDNAFLEIALQNAEEAGIALEIHSLDWRNLHREFISNSFEAALCLGNSISYLLNKKTQLAAICEFWRVLKRRGILIVDERNFQYLLDNREMVIGDKFLREKNSLYCGETVNEVISEIKNNRITFDFYKDSKRMNLRIVNYPFRGGELKNLLHKAGFTKILQYSDYKPGLNPKADFYQYLCMK